MAAKDKVLKSLQQVLLMRDLAGGGNTTIGTAAAKAQNTVLVPSTTNFAVGDTVRVGSGEQVELAVVSTVNAGVSLVMADPLTYDHAVGEPVVEQVGYDLGDIAEGGVTVNANAQTTDVGVATKRLAFTTLAGYSDLTAAFALPTITLQNLAIALGIAFTKIAGNGSASTPYSLVTDGSEISGEQNQSIIAIGVAMDGTVIRVELWGIDVDYTGLSLALSRGNLASVPVKVMGAGGVATTNASAYVANTTIKPTKGKVFSELSEVGLFADATVGPLSTSFSGAPAAGAIVLPLSSVTNLVAGDWLRIGSGDTVEFHRVESIAALNVTIKTPIYRAGHGADSVVRQVLVPFAAPSADGVTLSVAGSVETIRAGNRRMSIGFKPGAAITTLSFAVIDFLLANFARALGIPQAKIVGGRLPLTGDVISTDVVQGAYMKGLLQSGETQWINVWGCSQDVSNFAAQLTNSGTPSLPIAFKPASGVHFIQHA